MMNRVKTQTGPAPLIGGRAAFRGIINPLILAGGKFGQSPDIWASEYVNAVASPVAPSQSPIAIVKPAVETCTLSQIERDWCDFSGNQLPHCRKRMLPASDAACKPSAVECPLTDKVRKLCRPGYQGEYVDFCMGISRGGKCYEAVIRQEAEDEQTKKDAADKKAKDDTEAKAKADAEINQAKINNWKVTRGCRFHREDLTEADALTQTPCRTPAFNDARVGQYISSFGHRWKFLGWTPEQP
jgi:hypothetical protein